MHRCTGQTRLVMAIVGSAVAVERMCISPLASSTSYPSEVIWKVDCVGQLSTAASRCLRLPICYGGQWQWHSAGIKSCAPGVQGRETAVRQNAVVLRKARASLQCSAANSATAACRLRRVITTCRGRPICANRRCARHHTAPAWSGPPYRSRHCVTAVALCCDAV